MMLIGLILIITGSVFIFLGVFGVIRMPDVINRLQAGTKATTLGFLSIIAGVICLQPGWWPRLVLIGFFVLFTNPVGSHNLARAAHSSGEKLVIGGVDELSSGEEEA